MRKPTPRAPICAQCSSGDVYVKVDSTAVCRRCGYRAERPTFVPLVSDQVPPDPVLGEIPESPEVPNPEPELPVEESRVEQVAGSEHPRKRSPRPRRSYPKSPSW